MRKTLFFLIIICSFLFIFFKSNTWDTYKETQVKSGIEYASYKHSLHWDRFFDYIKRIPKNILESDIVRKIVESKEKGE